MLVEVESLVGFSEIEKEQLLADATIDRLPELLQLLPEAERKIFNQIFWYKVTRVDKPVFKSGRENEIAAKVGETPATFARTKVTRIVNWTLGEETLISQIRTKRRLQKAINGGEEAIAAINPPENCDFCDPFENTPEHEFGRVESQFWIGAYNLSPFEQHHGVVIAKNLHNPLKISADEFHDGVSTAWEMAKKFAELDPQARYPKIIFQRLPRSGASIYHSHFQVTSATECPYQRIEDFRQRTYDYRYKYGHDYFHCDLARCLAPLGLSLEAGSAKIVFNPTPRKEKETLFFANEPNQDFTRAIHSIFSFWYERFGATSLNLAIYPKPFDNSSDWEHFVWTARMVERGPEDAKTADMGSMEIYGPSVVGSDPLVVAKLYRQYLAKQT